MSKNYLLLVLLFFAAVKFSFSQNNGISVYSLSSVASGFFQYDSKKIAVDKNDDIWIAASGKGIIRFNQLSKVFTRWDTLNSALTSVAYTALTVDDQNRIWVSSLNKGIFFFDGVNWTNYNLGNSGLINDTTNYVAFKNNIIWVGTYKGAVYGTPGNWNVYDTLNSGINHNVVICIAFGNNGEIWFSHNQGKGLSEFKNNIWKTYDNTNSPLMNPWTYYLKYDSGNLYITSTGVFKYDGINFEKLDFTDSTFIYNHQFVPQYFNAGNGRICNISSQGILTIKDSVATHHYFEIPDANPTVIDSKGRVYYVGHTNWDTLYEFNPALYNSPKCSWCKSYDNGKYMEINKVKTAIMIRGDMHWNLEDARYEVPKGSGKNAVFASALWLGGLDDNNALHIAAQTYRQTGCDFFPGPLDTITGTIDSATAAYYDKIWKINRYDIEKFKYMFQNGQVQNGNYIMSTDMLTWPAQGIANTAKNLAPFIDINNDGNYNPYDGDYPNIKGDQMLWFVFNDTLARHSETQGVALGVEVHGAAYSYFCDTLNDSSDVMNTTTFYQYKFINRSAKDYHDMYAGIFCDVDLGWYLDDYVGCDTMNDIGFGYNGDYEDEQSYGYGLNPPMINVQILNGPEPVVNDGLDNNHNGIIDEFGERCMMSHFHTYYSSPGPWSNPYGANQFYAYLKSENSFGEHVTYGEDGHNPANPPTNYYYSGTPYDTIGWSEALVPDSPGDRRMLLSTGPFSLASHQTQTLDFAYAFTRDSTAPNGLTTSIARNIRDVKKIKHWFDVDSFPSCIKFEFPPIPPTVTIDSNILIYPNPAVYNFTLNIEDDYINNSEIKIYNSIGELVLKSKLQSKTISVEKLFRKGIYYVVVDKNGELKKGKFLKW